MSKVISEEDVKNRHITPALEKSGWKKEQMHMEYFIKVNERFTDGEISIEGKTAKRTAKRGERKKADYLLQYNNNFPIAIVEAKNMTKNMAHGIQQAIDYARRLDVPFAYSSNGEGFLEHDMVTGKEQNISLNKFPKPEDLWNRYCYNKKIAKEDETIIKVPYFYREGMNSLRYYQRIAVNRTIEAVTKNQRRILLVMATGTGKTYTAFQIVYRLYRAGKVKKVLYLADRNILIDQTILNDFAPFKDDGILTKVENKTFDKAYDIFMALYHQISGDDEEVFKQVKPDFFNLVVIDECHRGSAKDNSKWRKILDYYSNAIHIGMTATPKETEAVSNCHYFGESIYTYSLKQGINDGFLAPYHIFRFGIDKDLEGYIPEEGKLDIYGQEIKKKVYTERDFDRTLIIDDRTKTVARRITEFLKQSGNRYSKTIVFCVDEDHALRMRKELVNENADLCANNNKYVMRITGSDSSGKEQLENFIDSNSKYPTIVTTSELLSTGVDCKMCKVIVLDKIIDSITKFKQIIGRGTRLVWDKDKRFFTILDFRDATLKFDDPEFDGLASSVYVDKEKPIFIPDNDVDTDDDKGSEEGEIYKKHRINDVPTEIIREEEAIYGKDGKLIANHSAKLKYLIQKKYETEQDFIKDWLYEDKQSIISSFEKSGINFNGIMGNDNDIDFFDIILKYGFNQGSFLKNERVNNLKKDNFYSSLSSIQKKIVDELLNIYQKNDVISLEKIDVLELPNFYQFDGFNKTVDALGGDELSKKMIKELVFKLYKHNYKICQ